MKSVLGSLVVLVVTGCASTGFAGPPVPPPRAMLVGEAPRAHVSVRAERSEIEVVAGPFRIPPTDASASHAHHDGGEEMLTPLIVVPWPVDRGMAGFRMATYTSEGTPLDRELIHHVIGVNFSRRQLVYPVSERLFGFGTETPDIRLPSFL